VLTVEAGLYPEVTLGQYKGIEAEKAATEVTEEEIDAEVQKLADRNATVETVERPVENGDTAVIDFEGFLNGEAFEGGAGVGHPLKIGSGTFIPGFEEQLIGMNAGEEKDIDVTFPEDYGAEDLAGKAVVFHVKVNEVKSTSTPVLDDEFAKDVSETADTLADLRKELGEKKAKEKADEADRAFQNAVMEKAIENMTAVIPDAMVEEQLDSIMQQYALSMQQSGFSLEQYAQMMGTTVQGVRETQRASALSQIKNTLLLEKVAEVENIEVTDEQVEEAYKQMAEQYEMEIEKVKEYVPAEELVRDQKFQKAMELITGSAVEKAPEAPAAE
jgi:trigger factor